MNHTALILLLLGLIVSLAPLAVVHASHAPNILYPGDELAPTIIFPGDIGGLDWAPNGSAIALTLKEGAKLLLVSPGGEVIGSHELPSPGGSVAWSPNGTMMAVASGSRLLLYSPEGLALMEKEMWSRVTSIAWSGSGDRLAVGLENGTVSYYDVRVGAWRSYAYPGAEITAIGWCPTGNHLAWGDSLGRVRVLDLSTPNQTTTLEAAGTRITSLRVNPVHDIVAYSTETSTFLARIERGSITVYARIPHGTRGSISWSPDGEWLVIPSGDHAVVVGVDGRPAGEIYPPDIYPYTHASWDPTSYSRIAFAGYNATYKVGGLELIYSGAILEVSASHPVILACYESTCSDRIILSPRGQNLSLVLTVEGEAPGEGVKLVNATVKLRVTPLARLTRDAFTLLTDPELGKSVSADESLSIILRDPGTSLKVAGVGGEYKLSSTAILLGDGIYTFTLYYERPNNYLGPEELLKVELPVRSRPGEVAVYNYTWFRLEKLTATLQVSAPPNSTITLHYSGRAFTAVTKGESEVYLAPTGTLTVTLTLPSTGTLVDSPSILSRSYEATLYPGDVLSLSLTYGETLGKLTVRGPVGAMIIVTPPWSTPYNPVNYTLTLDQDTVEYWALPGTYTVEARVAFPDNYLGPTPPPLTVTVKVDKGRTSWIDLYSQKALAEALNQYTRSAYLTVESNPGYVLLVERGNASYRFNLSNGTVHLLAPPGNYTVSILDPSTNTIVNSKNLLVGGPGNITLSLQSAAPTQTTPAYIPSTPQPTQGPSTARIAVLAVIPIIAGALGYLLLRWLRGRMTPL